MIRRNEKREEESKKTRKKLVDGVGRKEEDRLVRERIERNKTKIKTPIYSCLSYHIFPSSEG